MDNPLNGLRDSVLIDELMKTDEGQKIAAKIKMLTSQLDALPQFGKQKFAEKFGNKFEETLEKLVDKNETTQVEIESNVEIYLIIFFVIIIVIFGKQPTQNIRPCRALKLACRYSLLSHEIKKT